MSCIPKAKRDINLLSAISLWATLIPLVIVSFVFNAALLQMWTKSFMKQGNDISTIKNELNGTVNKIKLMVKGATYAGIVSTLSTTIYTLSKYNICSELKQQARFRGSGNAALFCYGGWICAALFYLFTWFLDVRDNIEHNYIKVHGHMKTLSSDSVEDNNSQNKYVSIAKKILMQMVLFFVGSAFVQPFYYADLSENNLVIEANCVCPDEDIYTSYGLIMGLSFASGYLATGLMNYRRLVQASPFLQYAFYFLAFPVILYLCSFRIKIIANRWITVSIIHKYTFVWTDLFILWLMLLLIISIITTIIKFYKTQGFQNKFNDLHPICANLDCGNVLKKMQFDKNISFKCILCNYDYREKIFYYCDNMIHQNGVHMSSTYMSVCMYCANKQTQSEQKVVKSEAVQNEIQLANYLGKSEIHMNEDRERNNQEFAVSDNCVAVMYATEGQ
eukprot:88224_1